MVGHLIQLNWRLPKTKVSPGITSITNRWDQEIGLTSCSGTNNTTEEDAQNAAPIPLYAKHKEDEDGSKWPNNCWVSPLTRAGRLESGMQCQIFITKQEESNSFAEQCAGKAAP